MKPFWVHTPQNFKKKGTLILKIESVTIYLINLSTKSLFSNPGKMKIATYNPAKNKKLFLGLWFVAFIVLVLLFNWLFNIPVMKTNNVQNRFDATDLRLTRLKAIYAEFIIGYVKKDNLFTVNVTEIENEAKSIIGQVKGDLNYYKTVRYLSRENKIAGSLNELSDRVTNVEK